MATWIDGTAACPQIEELAGDIRIEDLPGVLDLLVTALAAKAALLFPGA
jgi:hypothetical protein